MATSMYPSVAKPAHVPHDLVRDIDLYNLPGTVDGRTDDIHRLWKNVQDANPPVFWTPRNGGHWLLTRHDQMQKVAIDAQRFSSRDIFIPQGTAPPLNPVNLDPPDHMRYRKLMMPAFAPAALAKATGYAHETAVGIIAQLKAKGGCEFVAEFSSVLPVVVFMSLINLPRDDLDFLRDVAGRFSPGTEDPDAGWATLSDYVRQQIGLRRHKRQDDWISSLLDAEIAGAPIGDEQIFSMVLLAISGGLDTVAITMTFFAAFLAANPDHRRQLIDDPALADAASEELMRRFGVSNIARVATQDSEIDGVPIRQGESVLMAFPLAGLDETVNPDPMTVDFHRRGGRHLLFGTGVHSCIGNRLAKRQLRIFLDEWLRQIPHFEIAANAPPVAGTGVVNRIEQLRLVWE